MTRIKICGITEPSQAVAAAEAGADYIGIDMAPSKRQVDMEKAKEIVAALKGSRAIPVGVFVNMPADEINRIAKYCNFDRIQLSGDEPWEFVKKLHRPAIKAVKVSTEHTGEKLLSELAGGYKKADYYFLPWSSLSIPPRCYMTTWWTSPTCAVVVLPPAPCSVMPPACWSATSCIRAPSK